MHCYADDTIGSYRNVVDCSAACKGNL